MPSDLLATLFAQLDRPFTGELLFDGLVDSVFFMKNALGQYALVNQTLAHRCGVTDKQRLLGMTAAEAFTAPYGEGYLQQDLALIASGKPLLNELELHVYPTGVFGWCLTTKLPLRGIDKRHVGLVGISTDLHAPREDYRDVAEALRQVQDRLSEPWNTDGVAQLANLSPFQLERRIRQVFHLSTSQLITKFRLDVARQYLLNSDLPIAQIALQCGYSDQSSFTRQFHRSIGLPPAQFRRRSQG